MNDAHRSAADMAHMLSGYMESDAKIKRAIAEEFMIPISIGAIAKIRAARKQDEARFARAADTWVEKCADPYHCGEYARRVEIMAQCNAVFLRALRRAVETRNLFCTKAVARPESALINHDRQVNRAVK